MQLAEQLIVHESKVDLTDSQRLVLAAAAKHANLRQAAISLDKDPSNFHKLWQRTVRDFADAGIAPQVNSVYPVPAGQKIKGRSTLYKDGKPVLEWQKTTAKHESLKEFAAELLAGMKDNLPRAEIVPQPAVTEPDLCAQYLITDYHLGMLAWGEETGANWDVKIAEELLIKWFAHAIDQAPAAETAIFAQLGDFLHFDGILPVTPTSKHVLDADTRFQNLIRVAIRVVRKIIEMLLVKHRNIHVVMAEGNHDIASSMWLKEILALFYDQEPRVSIEINPDPYYCHVHGDTILFYHHGHLKKQQQIDSVFVAKFRDEYGKSKHAYAHMGHLHHDKVLETNLMTVTQHRTLAAPDAHASRGGWMSGRDAKVTIYHKDHGKVQEMTINPGMVA